MVTPSRYDDELWELVPEDRGPPPEHERRFVQALGQAGRALDLGCGDGRLSSALQAEALTLADVSPVVLARAHARLPAARTVELTPDEPLPLGDGEFDLVLCAEMLEHVRDVQLLLSEVRRVLKPGGRLAITTPAHGRRSALRLVVRGFESEFNPLLPHLRFFTKKSLTHLLDELGFSVASLRRQSGSLLVVAER
ncbi:MAG TPA: class I SAM-dependent methyltransferase [Thermoleophilaceae bacterium]|nr:class I SAM-dependent methyltransferase [Thermoleophilaceae bacterium]